MIKNILLPEKIGSYYLFAKRIIGFEVTQSHVFATVTYLRAHSSVIEKCIALPIEQENGDTLPKRTAQTIQKIIKKIGSYDEIRTALSSAHVIFKSMRLPFDDIEKIQKVIDFEVEPLLPFSIANAVVDFIITKPITEQNSSEVLVAAVQKQYITQQLELFNQAGVHPEVITVDLFDLYGLYKQIPTYSKIKDNVTLIEINSEITKIAFITNGQLRFIRTLNTGINSIATQLATELSLSPRDALDQLMRFGFNHSDEASTQALQRASSTLKKQIQFTLQSFTAQTEISTLNNQMFLLGIGAEIIGIADWIGKELNIPCALFNPTEVTQNTNIIFKNMVTIPVANSISTAASLPTETVDHFNLRKKEFAPSSEQLLLKQLILGGILIFGLFAGIFMHSFLQLRKLRIELDASKAETAEVLNEWFPEIDRGPIDDMLDEAQEETVKEEKLWFSFARSAHNSLLNLLLELTGLDRDGLGLIIEKITIDQDRGIMTLKAQVRDHEALIRLENELRQSDLFSYVQPQDNPNFNMELRFADERQGDT
ncbi:MAG: pilus assembly protein PilM [Candidatus Dependentiae bacterium]